jgi:hypothetical protein
MLAQRLLHRLPIATYDRAIRKSRAAVLWRPATA